MTESVPGDGQEPVAIVGVGCVLPGACNVQEFWSYAATGEHQIRPLPLSRWIGYQNHPGPSEYCAATIDNSVVAGLCNALGIDRGAHTRAEVLALAAFAQINEHLRPESLEAGRVCFSLGSMYSPEELGSGNFCLDRDLLTAQLSNEDGEARRAVDQVFDRFEVETHNLTTSVIHAIKTRHRLQGEGWIVDAACASSLAAVQVAINQLRFGRADFVITGGLEANLQPVTFEAFELVGALSPEPCVPFDRRHCGLTQGEGVVLFVLQRLSDALAQGQTIWGVIRSVGASSDGRGASLFAPTIAGQRLAYARAYANLANNRVDFIEAHGTGTVVGDQTELASLGQFFSDLVVPIGSTKALVGHTRGASGAVGLLRALLCIRNGQLPPSPYFDTFPKRLARSLFVNRKPRKLKKRRTPFRVGVSAFGFGGTNYHLVVDEYKETPHQPTRESVPMQDEAPWPVIVAEASVVAQDADAQLLTAEFRIPPAALSAIDSLQRQAMACVGAAFRQAHLDVRRLDRSRVSVIAASLLPVESQFEFNRRVTYSRVLSEGVADPEARRLITQRRDSMPVPTEDSPPGMLNNVIAGRICNLFDFRGKSFNVDADTASHPCALGIALLELRSRESDFVVLVWATEKVEASGCAFGRERVDCWLLAPQTVAMQHDLPILATVESVDYSE